MLFSGRAVERIDVLRIRAGGLGRVEEWDGGGEGGVHRFGVWTKQAARRRRRIIVIQIDVVDVVVE
jgi:hypothetical protein